MTRAIKGLLTRAATAALDNGGVVPSDIALELAAEGYDTTKLDRDVERMIERTGLG